MRCRPTLIGPFSTPELEDRGHVANRIFYVPRFHYFAVVFRIATIFAHEGLKYRTSGVTATSRTPPWLPSGPLGFPQDGDVGVGVFPEGEEVLILGTSFGSVTGESVGAGEADLGDRTGREVDHDAAVVEKPLKFYGCGTAVMGQ